VTPIPREHTPRNFIRPGTLRAAVLVALLIAAAAVLRPGDAFAVTEHIVQPGETLSEIADLYGLPVETLMDVNGITDPNAVQEGQVIRIPDLAGSTPPASPEQQEGRFHTVQDGDTLSSLAALFGVSPEEIAEANGLFDLHSVIAGATLRIPGAPPADEEDASGEEVVSDSGRRHTVIAGEVLSIIAEVYGVRLAAIIAANGLDNPDHIIEGQTLVVPGAFESGPEAGETSTVVHVVGAGETLTSIAEKYGVDLSRLADANNLADHDVIILGENLVIPGAHTPSQTSGYADITHIVQMGETLSAIANRYSVKISTLVEANALADPNLVIEGQSLAVPGASAASAPGPAPAAPVLPAMRTHIVVAGQTLASIAAHYGLSMESLVEANGLLDPDHIIEGQALVIPGGIADRVFSLDDYEAILEDAAAEFGVPAALIKALAWQESGWNQFVVSFAGAVGLMQVTPWTAEWALATLIPDATAWQTDPVANARMGVAILHHWLERSDWSVETALGAYYQGWRSLHEIGVYEETTVYIASVLSLVSQFE
jgi:LysM repeat protein